MTPALEGVRVLDLATVGPAARASRILADYGASVTKVGAVPRAGGVQITPPFYAYSGNRGMTRALFDLKSADGRNAFLGLVAEADVVIESFRPGVADRLGIGYAALREANPAIILCSTSGYGQDGPRRDWAGHDINYLATSGFLDCSGRQADGRPALPGATVADIAAGGMQAAMAIMAALLRRERGEQNRQGEHTRQGEHIDVSIADGAFTMMSLYVDEYLATGNEPGPGHYILTGRYACYDTYRCADGRYVSVGAIEPRFWANLCELIGLPQFASQQTEDDAQDEIRDALAAKFATEDRDHWVELLGPADTCVAPVNTVAEAAEDPHTTARALVVDAVSETDGPFRQSAPGWAGTVPPDGAYEVAATDSTDTESLLASAGLDAHEIERMLDEGVIA
ncbi:MAG: CoA transferase [Microthrixaceae bacterium]|nr:CoA transferase [Microthrixaceae bacterium]MCO5321567.1 CoA transferase [Microthrixaceae bacterium]